MFLNGFGKSLKVLQLSKKLHKQHEPCYPKPNKSGTKIVLGRTECQTAIIMGGVGDIGIAVARQLLCEKAAKVGLVDMDICKGKEMVTTLNCAFGKEKSVFARANITDKGSTKEALQMMKKEFKKSTEILVNTAGVWDDNLYEKEVDVNFTGPIYINSIAKDFVKNPGGIVVNVVGLAGLEPFSPSPMLSATFAGIIAFSRAMGHQKNFVRTGIRVVTLCTGITDTNFMKDSSTKTCCEDMAKDLELYLQETCWQKAEAVAKAVVQLIRHASSGKIGTKVRSTKVYGDVINCDVRSNFTSAQRYERALFSASA